MRAEFPERLNIADWLLDARVREGRGDRQALLTDHGTFTYREVQALANRFGHLLETAGVEPEQRVIIALPDGPEFVAALFGTLKVGAVVVMVNPQLAVDAIEYFYAYTRASVALVHRHTAPAFQAARRASGRSAHLKQIIVIGEPATTRAIDGASPELETFPSHRDDAALWLFSGGTTGKPKAVVQSHASFANTTVRYGQQVLGLTERDVTLAVPKLFFGYATGSNVFFPFSVGASCVLFPGRCTPAVLVDQIRRHRPTVLVNVPTMIQQMLAESDAGRDDLAGLRLTTSAGEALPAELHERWMRRFGVELLDGLGTAEMWHIFLTNRPGDVVPGTLGRPVPGFEIKLCDADGHEVADGEVGVLWVRGESRAIGYWHQMDDTMRAFRGEWYVSGDMLRRNADGTFVYCGRSDDMLKVGGRWLAPGELENCLVSHPSVREVAVVGVRNADGLVKPCAFVVSDDASPALAAELQAYAKSKLEPYKYPREVVFVAALPRTHLGKIDRGALARHRLLA